MISTTTIQELWSKFVTHENQKAYDDLYQHYFHYLRFIGLKKGFDTEIVKDSINEVFLHCWEKRAELHHIHHPHNYIVTVFLRKVYREEKQEPSADAITSEFDETNFINILLPTAEDNLVSKENSQAISRMVKQYLEQLPPRQREMIYQKFYLGLSYQEIAKAGGLSVNTVYNTLYNAMDKLRSLLPKNILFSVIPLVATVCATIF